MGRRSFRFLRRSPCRLGAGVSRRGFRFLCRSLRRFGAAVSRRGFRFLRRSLRRLGTGVSRRGFRFLRRSLRRFGAGVSRCGFRFLRRSLRRFGAGMSRRGFRLLRRSFRRLAAGVSRRGFRFLRGSAGLASVWFRNITFVRYIARVWLGGLAAMLLRQATGIRPDALAFARFWSNTRMRVVRNYARVRDPGLRLRHGVVGNASGRCGWGHAAGYSNGGSNAWFSVEGNQSGCHESEGWDECTAHC